jgi:hypothetical protein
MSSSFLPVALASSFPINSLTSYLEEVAELRYGRVSLDPLSHFLVFALSETNFPVGFACVSPTFPFALLSLPDAVSICSQNRDGGRLMGVQFR